MRQRLVTIGSACILMLAFAPAGASAAGPVVTSGSASAITATGATLEASIDPGDDPDGVYYQFQLSEFPAEFPDELSCPPPSPGPFLPCVGPESQAALPIGHIAAGDGPAEVSLDLAAAGVSLEPGQTYYFRAVAAPAVASEDTIEWEKPVAGGGDQTFRTASSPASAASPPGPAAGGSSGSQAAPVPQRKHHGKQRHRRSGGVAISRARPAL